MYIGYSKNYTLLFYPEFIMKIIALSDMHGNLNQIQDSCDVVVIAGDWSPLYCQQDYNRMLDYIDRRFIPWMMNLKTDHVIFIPGNHDLVCSYSYFVKDYSAILKRHRGASDKIHYLCHSSIILYGKKFYGNPNSEAPKRWAFSKEYNQSYNFDADTDILITHQPPRFGDVGYVALYNKELGSNDLKYKILDSNIQLNICGHIHTGEHGCHAILLNNNMKACVYNVSILDEDYRVAFEPTVIELS